MLQAGDIPAGAMPAGAGFPPGTINLGPGTGPGNVPGYFVAIPIGNAPAQAGANGSAGFGAVAAAPGNWAPGGAGGFAMLQGDNFPAAVGPGVGASNGRPG